MWSLDSFIYYNPTCDLPGTHVCSTLKTHPASYTFHHLHSHQIQVTTTSRLNYYNSLLPGLPASALAPLKSIFNTSARVIILKHVGSCQNPPRVPQSLRLKSRHSTSMSYEIWPPLNILTSFPTAGLLIRSGLCRVHKWRSRVKVFTLSIFSPRKAPACPGTSSQALPRETFYLQ